MNTNIYNINLTIRGVKENIKINDIDKNMAKELLQLLDDKKWIKKNYNTIIEKNIDSTILDNSIIRINEKNINTNTFIKLKQIINQNDHRGFLFNPCYTTRVQLIINSLEKIVQSNVNDNSYSDSKKGSGLFLTNQRTYDIKVNKEKLYDGELNNVEKIFKDGELNNLKYEKDNESLASFMNNEGKKQYILLNETRDKYIIFGDAYTRDIIKSEIRELGKGFQGVVFTKKNEFASFVTKKITQTRFDDSLKNEIKYFNDLTYKLNSTSFVKSDGNLAFLSDYLVCGPLKAVRENQEKKNEKFYLIPRIQIVGTLKDNYHTIKSNISMNEIKDLILAIERLNQIGYFHCDGNLENIVMTKDNKLKLIDFGLSKKEIADNKYNYASWLSKGNSNKNDEYTLRELEDLLINGKN